MSETWREWFAGWEVPGSLVHPDAPSGGSGPGGSRPAGAELWDWRFPTFVPHPDSPAGRTFDYQDWIDAFAGMHPLRPGTAPALPEADTLSASVGRGGVNRAADVRLVQSLIDAHPLPGVLPLVVDGRCGPFTIAAIETLQRRYLGMTHADGRVDPDGPTWRALLHGHPPAGRGHARFPADIVAAAQHGEETWKIPAAVTLAQWALESDWGRAMPTGSNNPFGIKAVAGQPYFEATTHEVVHGRRITIIAKFRKFASLADAFDAHARLLATAHAYAAARRHLDDPNAFADALTGVYATDPAYGTKLKAIMKSNDLYRYD